jgi:very-short-patch-repair endonuclease
MRKRVRTLEQFVERASEVHNDKYNYAWSMYQESKLNMIIICPEHGAFLQTPSSHLSGAGCGECSKNKRKSIEQFIKEANEKHDNFYNYDKSVYVNRYTVLTIVCPKHGDFPQTPGNHLNGCGCPTCANERILVGKNEAKYFQPMIRDIFPDADFQHDFPGLPYFVDAFIPSLNLVIEYDEPRHFEPKRQEKDQERQLIIEAYHKVDFIRIKDSDMLSNPNAVRKRLQALVEE